MGEHILKKHKNDVRRDVQWHRFERITRNLFLAWSSLQRQAQFLNFKVVSPGHTNACNRRLLSDHCFSVSEEFCFICMIEVGLDEGPEIS